MRVLVTGGAGFIGSHVVDALRAAGHEPRVFDVRQSPHHPRGSVDTAIGNVLDPAGLRSAMRGCDAVAHLAAAADVGEVAKDPAAAEELNSRGTLNVLEAARATGVERVIYASTIWVYGACDRERVDEETPLGLPDHMYTATKLSGEMYCRSYSELYGLDCTVLRFGIPYGPRARPAAVIPAFVNRALAGEAITIAGSGEQHRRFVYVEDLADGVARALAPGAANRTYNLVGGEDVSVRRIADTVCDLVGDVEVVHTEGRAADFGGVEVSGARAAAELGWRPSTGFDEGVGRYLAWHREHAAAAAAPRPARPSRAGQGLVSAGAGGAALVGAVGLLGAYLVSLYNVAGEEATRSVLAVMLTALAVGTIVTRREASGWASAALAWLVAIAGALAVALPWPRHLLDEVRPDVSFTLLCIGAIGFAAALVVGRRRMAPRSSRTEQTQDSGS